VNKQDNDYFLAEYLAICSCAPWFNADAEPLRAALRKGKTTLFRGMLCHRLWQLLWMLNVPH
jgi:hypothetical protein